MVFVKLLVLELLVEVVVREFIVFVKLVELVLLVEVVVREFIVFVRLWNWYYW